MTRVASLVCDLGRRVRESRLGNAMTRRAVPVNGVVLGVAVVALRLRRREPEGDGRGMAFEARPRGVLRVHEFHAPLAGRVTGDGNGDGLRLRCAVLLGLVACLASSLLRRLMVADGAPARALERKTAVTVTRFMADDAGDPRVPVMRESIGDGGGIWSAKRCSHARTPGQ